MSWFASPCTAPQGQHFVVDRKQHDNGRIVWGVSAKTFFEITMCYVRAKENHCNCRIEFDGEQCNWCKSVCQILSAASYFHYQNSNSKEIVTCFMLEFANPVPCYDCVICARNKHVLVYALKIKVIRNENEREQDLSDYEKEREQYLSDSFFSV